jgi:hypothetical protein
MDTRPQGARNGGDSQQGKQTRWMRLELQKALINVADESSKQDLINLQGLWRIVNVGDKIRFKHNTWEARLWPREVRTRP